MHKKLIIILLLLVIAMPGSVFSSSESTADSEKTSQPLESGPGWKIIRSLPMGKSGKYVHLVLIDQKRYIDKTIYSNAINRLCRTEKEFCRIRFWSQERHIPEKVSVTPAQYKELRAEYTFNKAAGIRQLLWSCSVDPDRSHCLEQ